MCLFGSRSDFALPYIVSLLAEAGEWKAQQRCAVAGEKSVINMMWLLLPVFDWPNIMIGPGGLLILLFAVPVSWVGLQKSK